MIKKGKALPSGPKKAKAEKKIGWFQKVIGWFKSKFGKKSKLKQKKIKKVGTKTKIKNKIQKPNAIKKLLPPLKKKVKRMRTRSGEYLTKQRLKKLKLKKHLLNVQKKIKKKLKKIMKKSKKHSGSDKFKAKIMETGEIPTGGLKKADKLAKTMKLFIRKYLSEEKRKNVKEMLFKVTVAKTFRGLVYDTLISMFKALPKENGDYFIPKFEQQN